MPLRDYEAFRPMVERIADGEPNVLTGESVRYLGLTSGTTGRGKLVPITGSAQRQIMAHMVLTTRGAITRHRRGRRFGPGLLLRSSVLPSKIKAGIPIGTGTQRARPDGRDGQALLVVAPGGLASARWCTGQPA